MRLIIENAEQELLSVIQSLKTDKDSWEDWTCLCIETPELEGHPDRTQIQFNIGVFLDGHLNSEYGSILFLGFREILIFSKNVSEAVLRGIGGYIIDQIMKETQRPSYFRIFNLARDHDRLIDAYALEDFIANTSKEHLYALSQENFQYPDFEEGAGDMPLDPDAKRVLLVEDDPVTRWMVRTAVKNDCDLMTAANARRAMVMYRNYKPDLVLLDINLPDMSGKEILSEIMDTDPGAFVVMFSSQDSMENITETMEDGARGFIAKPFRKERLLHYIESCPVAH